MGCARCRRTSRFHLGHLRRAASAESHASLISNVAGSMGCIHIGNRRASSAAGPKRWVPPTQESNSADKAQQTVGLTWFHELARCPLGLLTLQEEKVDMYTRQHATVWALMAACACACTQDRSSSAVSPDPGAGQAPPATDPEIVKKPPANVDPQAIERPPSNVDPEMAKTPPSERTARPEGSQANQSSAVRRP